MEERENRFGIIIERNVAIPVRDGVVLRANVFRPDTTGEFPGLLTRTPYGKAQQGASIGLCVQVMSWYHKTVEVAMPQRGNTPYLPSRTLAKQRTGTTRSSGSRRARTATGRWAPSAVLTMPGCSGSWHSCVPLAWWRCVRTRFHWNSRRWIGGAASARAGASDGGSQRLRLTCGVDKAYPSRIHRPKHKRSGPTWSRADGLAYYHGSRSLTICPST